MQTRKQVVAVMMAGTLALAGCASGDADVDDTDPVTDTTAADTIVETTVTETTMTDTTEADTSTADTSTTGATTDATSDPTLDDDTDGGVAGIDLDALESRFEEVGDQVEATGDEALTDAWDELETRFGDVRDAVESGDFADLSAEDVSTALQDVQDTIEQNVDELDPSLVEGWNELVAELEAAVPAISG
jgi:hypothetical protein